MAQALVTIGVPVYHGDAFLEETLSSIQGQTYLNLDVIFSLDGPDSTCEQIVSRFLADSRFRLVVQPERLGWFGNLNWLMRNVSGDFWVYHGQDDRTSRELHRSAC
jgi:glycosyltransferase involved in cell wall biosynthesis